MGWLLVRLMLAWTDVQETTITEGVGVEREFAVLDSWAPGDDVSGEEEEESS